MIRRSILILCLGALLFLSAIGLAEGTEAASFFVTDPNGETEDFIIATAALDGRLYMLSHQRLYEYAPDQPDVVILLDWGGIMASLNHGQSREAWLEDFARTRVNALIQGEDAVYGVNHRYGTLFRLDGGDRSPWGAVDPALAGLEDSFGPMFMAGEHLYYAAHTDDEDADVLVDYDLARQSRVCHEAGRVHDIALVEGQVALLRESRATEGALEIALLALRTGQVSVAAVFPDRDVSGLCAYLQDDQVLALQASGGASRMGFIPWHAGSLQYGLLMLTPDTAALTSPQGIWVRPLTEHPQEERSLRLCLKDTAYVPSFQASCPDVTLSLTDASGLSGEELIRGLLDGTLAQDVIEVDAATLFPAMADKGYLAELSASAVLAAEHEQLYPALQQVVCRDGRLYGVPASLRVRCWAYQPERLFMMLHESDDGSGQPFGGGSADEWGMLRPRLLSLDGHDDGDGTDGMLSASRTIQTKEDRAMARFAGRYGVRIISLLLGLALLTASARAEAFCSIRDIVDGTPRRWTETYETEWRTVTIDVPIDVPPVAAFPIVRVRLMPAVPEDLLGEYEGTVRNLAGSLTADRRKDDSLPPGSRPMTVYTYLNGAEPQEQPERVALTYGEALQWCYRETERLWGLKDTDFAVEKVVVEGRAYHYSRQGGKLIWGKPVTEQGRYKITFGQLIHGIGVEGGKECYDRLGLASETALHHVSCYMAFSDPQNVKIRAALYEELEVVHADVPLLPFAKAKEAMEAEIYAGHLRSLDEMKLCYIPYLDAEDRDVLWLLPAWYARGIYTRDARQELVTEAGGDGQDAYDNLERREVIFQAQQGELIDYLDQGEDRRVAPAILTWDSVR